MLQYNNSLTNKSAFMLVWLLLIFASACSKENAYVPAAPNLPPDTTVPVSKSYLALGDSYTIGQSVNAAYTFPAETVNLLRMQEVPMKSPEIIATSGWTTGNLISALAGTPPASANYDFVTLLIGVNNQYQGRSQSEYSTQFTSLLNKAIGYAGGKKNRVFVLSIPDYSVTPFAQNYDTVRISNEIDAFNAINKQISLDAGVSYLDITDISREGRYDASLQAPDGLHPSGRQYQRWAGLLAPMMKASL